VPNAVIAKFVVVALPLIVVEAKETRPPDCVRLEANVAVPVVFKLPPIKKFPVKRPDVPVAFPVSVRPPKMGVELVLIFCGSENTNLPLLDATLI
jgi:hypothetical protein